MGQALAINDVLGVKPSETQLHEANLRSLAEERANAKTPEQFKALDTEIASEKALLNKAPDATAPRMSDAINEELLAKPAAPAVRLVGGKEAPRARDQTDLVDKQEKRPVPPWEKDTALTQATRETAHAVGSSIYHSAKGGWEGLGVGLAELARSGGDVDLARKAAAQAVREEQEKSYRPEGEGAKTVLEALGSKYNPLNWGAMAGKAAGEANAEMGGSPLASTAVEVAGNMVDPVGLLKGVKALKGAEWFQRPTPAQQGLKAGEKSPHGSVGAAAASANAAAVAAATPELRAAITGAKNANPTAVTRHLEADSLPIPIKLTKGEATGDVAEISREWNAKGKVGEISARQAERPEQFHQNLDAIRDEVAPDVYGADHVQNGRTIIESYENHLKQIDADIKEKYQKLADANGGDLPIDAKSFAENAEAALKKELKTHYLPAPIKAQLEAFKAGETMTFEQFETLRTNLAADIRAEKGNVSAAAHIVRQALEDLPLRPEAAHLKGLADEARSAFKAKKALLEKDPAAKAIDEGKATPDDFIQKYVINGKVDNVKTMIENLQPGSPAHQTMAAGVINHLKNNAGKDFNQANFNKGLKAVSPDGKLLAIAGPKAAQQLETIGKVADYTQRLPRGHFANTSNTLVAALAEHAKSGAEGYANLKSGGFPVGTYFRNKFEHRSILKNLEVGAGIEK